MDLIFNDTNNNFKVFTDVIFLLSAGLILRFSLSLTGQNWVKTYQQTVTFLILPVGINLLFTSRYFSELIFKS